MQKAAVGKATKIIIPSEIQSIAGLVKSVTEIGADDKKEEKVDKRHKIKSQRIKERGTKQWI